MIFSHIPKPLGMRICPIPKRIYVHRVPLDTSWFCSHCCATVDTALVIPRGTGSRTRMTARLTHLLVTLALRFPSVTNVSGRIHEERYASCTFPSLSLLAEALSASKSRLPHVASRRRKKLRADEPIRTADLLQLRVMHQALQGCAGGCKCRIFRGVSLLRLAECCTVLRSRWYQSGIKPFEKLWSGVEMPDRMVSVVIATVRSI
jgi:hypothetical protein